ncbi:hypothetical protein QQM39_25565 [Streptomyces sp. DT2A-34]|uniref:hypothetical protein n=1 Tax=Streptomyces sp. DT2A-34 TaxID=3051182 RepID=UPI00265C42C8|nr:hypothetical protein [Streptomyces sp. DT2A-34]MDO0914078.1 hypothetical protein [Streptomyces sp. DT2A-34]
MEHTTKTKGGATRRAAARSRKAAMGAVALALTVTGVAAHSAAAADTRAISYPSRLKKCADLDCKVQVKKGEGFRAHRFWIERVTFPQISKNNIQIKAYGDGTEMGCGGTPPLHCTINGVDFTVKDVRGNTARTVRIHP